MKKITALLAALVLCLMLSACSTGSSTEQPATGEQAEQEQASTIAYVVSDEKLEYTRSDQTGMAYRVSVAANATEDELKAVFAKVVADDGFNMHEVWFYSDEQLTDGSAAFDVALASQSSADGEVTVTMASEESKEAAKTLLTDKAEADKVTEGAAAPTDGGEDKE